MATGDAPWSFRRPDVGRRGRAVLSQRTRAPPSKCSRGARKPAPPSVLAGEALPRCARRRHERACTVEPTWLPSAPAFQPLAGLVGGGVVWGVSSWGVAQRSRELPHQSPAVSRPTPLLSEVPPATQRRRQWIDLPLLQCSGTALMFPDVGLWAFGAINSSTLSIADHSATVAITAYQSLHGDDGVCLSSTASSGLVPAIETTVPLYVPPFQLAAEPCTSASVASFTPKSLLALAVMLGLGRWWAFADAGRNSFAYSLARSAPIPTNSVARSDDIESCSRERSSTRSCFVIRSRYGTTAASGISRS
jgi:hypothetical protein